MLLILLACSDPPPPEPPKVEPAKLEAPAAPEGFDSTITLDGQIVAVQWEDGDTLRFPPAGPGGKTRTARLAGYNTLESYGPVHRWGQWTPAELHAVAKEAGVKAGGGQWACRKLDGGGGYGRELVDCPELRAMMLREGYGHVFAVGDAADPADLALQQEAIARGRGMWAKGAPKGLVTSLHSADENSGRSDERPGKGAYNRVLDLSTGQAPERPHADTYGVCQEVCMDDSCMLYVPYEQRYGESRAACLNP